MTDQQCNYNMSNLDQPVSIENPLDADQINNSKYEL